MAENAQRRGARRQRGGNEPQRPLAKLLLILIDRHPGGRYRSVYRVL